MNPVKSKLQLSGMAAVSLLLFGQAPTPARAESAEAQPAPAAEAPAPVPPSTRSTRPGRSGRGDKERPVQAPAEPVVPVAAPAAPTVPTVPTVPTPDALAPTEASPAIEPARPPAAAPKPAAAALPTLSDERAERRKRMEDQQRAAEDIERQRRDARYRELSQDQEDAGLGDVERRQRQLESGRGSAR